MLTALVTRIADAIGNWRLPAWPLRPFAEMPRAYRWWMAGVLLVETLVIVLAAGVQGLPAPSESVAYIGVAVGITLLATNLSFRLGETVRANFQVATGVGLVLADRPVTAFACVLAGALLCNLRRPIVRHLFFVNIATDLAQVALVYWIVAGPASSPDPLSALWVGILLGSVVGCWLFDSLVVFVPSVLGGYATWDEVRGVQVAFLRSGLSASLPQVALSGLVLGHQSPWLLPTLLFPFLISYEIFSRSEEAVSAVLKQRQLRDQFAGYVPEAVVDRLVEGDEQIEMGGEQRDISVLFCDIRGFTAWSEHLAPAEVVCELNRLLAMLTSCVFETGGTLDKFTGDGLMAFWGAPLEQDDHADRATNTALLMMSHLREFNAAHPGHAFRLGIGVHSGPAVVGNIGHEQRHDYTAIGDTVNLSARVEAATKELGVDALVTAATFGRLDGAVRTRCEPMPGAITVKGRQQPVEVLRIVPLGEVREGAGAAPEAEAA